MMQRTLQALALATLGTFLGACGADSVVSSANVSTENVLATIEIYSDDGDNAYASTQLIRAGSTSGDDYLDLRGGDALWFTTGENLREASLGENWFESLAELSKAQELFEGEYRYRPTGFGFFFFWSTLIPEQVHYNGRLTEVPEGGRYTVSLLRGSGVEALDSNVEMPLSFDLQAPTDQLTFSRSSDPLIVEWLPIEEDVSVELDITTRCHEVTEHRYSKTFSSDEGYAELEPGAIDAGESSGECSTTLTLAKVRLGQLDSAYAGGSITARQIRSVTFTSSD